MNLNKKAATCINKVHFLFVNLLGHDASHVDGKEGRVPLLLLRGCVNRKELQGEPMSISRSQPTELNLGVNLTPQVGEIIKTHAYLNSEFIVELAERQPQDFKPGQKKRYQQLTHADNQ